jgi:hypothetical protein
LFYKCLQDALMPPEALDVDGKSVASSESPAAPAKDSIQVISNWSPGTRPQWFASGSVRLRGLGD